MFEPLQLWRAQWVATALWRVVHGEARWIPLSPEDPRPSEGSPAVSYALTTRQADAPAYLPVYVPPLSDLGLEREHLRLWRSDYQAFLRGLHPGERQVLEAWLGKGKATPLAVWNAAARRLQITAPLDAVDLFVRLARCATLDTPPPPEVK